MRSPMLLSVAPATLATLAAVAALAAAACRGPAPAEVDAGLMHLTSGLAVAPADEDVNRTVEARILASRQTEPDTSDVRISTHAGIVTLRGSVSSALEKQRLYEIAATTPGVSSVVDEIVGPQENPSVLNDEAIGKALQARFDQRGAKDVRVSSVGGKVILEGSVLTNVEKAELEKIAKSTPSVTSVDDQLRVRPLDKP